MASLEEKYLRNCAVSTSCTKTFNIAAIKGAAVVVADEERRRVYRAQREDSGRTFCPTPPASPCGSGARAGWMSC